MSPDKEPIRKRLPDQTPEEIEKIRESLGLNRMHLDSEANPRLDNYAPRPKRVSGGDPRKSPFVHSHPPTTQ